MDNNFNMNNKTNETIVGIDNLGWAINLACPPSVYTNSVGEILNRGISSCVWDEISSKIYSTKDVIESRKNILLHYLRNHVSITSIQSMKNMKRLEKERKIVASQIEFKHRECTIVDTSLRKKGLKLIEMQSEKKALQLKRNALELKCKETKAGMIDFQEMFLVSQTLLPSFRSGINETIMKESLTLAGAISSRADKREALKQLSENFGSAAISELWSWILNKRICDTEELVHHGFQYDSPKALTQKHGQRLNIGVAKACGHHIMSTTAKLMHMKKGNMERIRGIHYLDKIETSLPHETFEDFQDWLTSTVEVAQLQENHRIMQSEIAIMRSMTGLADDLRTRHLQLASEIHEINMHMKECSNKIQQALLKFEPTGQSLIILKNQLATALNMIAKLNHQPNVGWQADNLSPEIEAFQENLNINALNKVLLSGKVGAYRHSSCCISNATINTLATASLFPVYEAPLYHLVCCSGNLMAHNMLILQRDDPTIPQHLGSDSQQRAICATAMRQNDMLDLLHDTNIACERCQREIEMFDSVYNSWVYQLANECMTFDASAVHGATYDEWMQRYGTLVYMVQRNK